MATSDAQQWQCPTCGELIPVNFYACWNCGTEEDGDRDPTFEITEPIEAADGSESAFEQPPILQLSDWGYFGFPVYIWTMLSIPIRQMAVQPHQLNMTLSDAEFLVLFAIGLCTTGIPMLVAVLPYLYKLIIYHGDSKIFFSRFLSDFLRMYQLPEHFEQRYPWYAPVYQGSIVCLCAVPMIILVIQLFI